MHLGMILFFLLTASLASAAMAQLRINTTPSCRTCQLTWTQVTAIDGSDGHLSGYPPSAFRSADGTVVLIDASERLPFVFRADGTYLKTIGRKGAGPGEFSFARIVIGGPDGAIHILDPVLARHTVIATTTTTHSVPLMSSGPGLYSALMMPNGNLITNQVLRDPDGAGIPLQEYDSTGQLLLRFGGNETVSFDEPWRVERALYGRTDGTVLALNAYANILEIYDRARSLRSTYSRAAAWLAGSDPSRQPSGGHSDQRPSVVGKAVWEDSSGLTWIATLVPAPHWKPVAPGSEIPPPQDRFHTVLEAIDLQARRVVAVDTLPYMIATLVSPGYLATYSERADGTPVVEVWEVNLSRGGNKQ